MKDSLIYLKEGQKVKINFQNTTKHNSKRTQWIQKHKNEIFTVVYDKWKEKPQIVALREDESNPACEKAEGKRPHSRGF